MGKDGKRNILDRFQSHEHLQKIMADINTSGSAKEVFILGYKFEFHRVIASNEGKLEASVSKDEGFGHFGKILESRISRESRILLAEAALINYVKPFYNEKYKDSFPNRREHKILGEILTKEFTGLIVEVNTDNLKCNLFSESRPIMNLPFAKELGISQFHHIAEFPLYLPEERNIFLNR